MDLHVDKIIVFDQDTTTRPPFRSMRVDPRKQDDIDSMFSKLMELPLYIPPKARVLMSTWEEVDIPPDVVGLIALRSTWARLGFVSPPTLADPGYRGKLTMELVNLSNHEILVSIGDAIWSMVRLQLVPGSEPMYKGRYQGQVGLQLPKALLED